MITHFDKFGGLGKRAHLHLRRSRPCVALVVSLASALVTSPVGAQTQTGNAAALTDSQALVLLQSLAKGQGIGSAALSAAQMQLLSQYLQRASQSATVSGGIDLARAQMLVAQSQAAAPGSAQRSVQTAGAVLPQIAAAPSAPAAAPSSLSEKKPGTIRIAVVRPAAQMGQGNSGFNLADPLRTTIMAYLTGPKFDVIPISAMLPPQIEAEAKEKGCDYTLYSSISQKMSSGGFGMLKKAMPLAGMVPMVGAVGGMATMVAGSAAGAAMSGGLAGSVKAKCEVTFDYKLMAPGKDTPVLANSAKAKAKQDGEDVITPLLEQAATAILSEVSKKN